MSSLSGTLRRGTSGGRSSASGAAAPSASEAGSTRISGISQGAGFVTEFKAGAAEIMQGRLTLIMLDTLVLAMLAFYVWTHNAQGGG